MMNKEIWFDKILTTVGDIADRDYQARAWFGKGPEVSSPDEMFNELFDDLDFTSFFFKYCKDFTEVQASTWRDLESRLDSYARMTPEKLDPHEVFNDPRWQEIRNTATRFVQVFGGQTQRSS